LLLVVYTQEHIKKLKEQDPNAFNEFYLGTVDMFFRYINANYSLSKEDAEDVISDFYIKFWEAIIHYKEELSFT
jgi:DNA-directed RNA polymerase specialized sigma24 family protein